MNLLTLFIDIILTIPLSIILINLEKKENSFTYLCIFPVLYTIIISAIIPGIKENIFLIPIFEIFIRNFYITNITEEIKNNKEYILSSVVSIILSVITYNYFIKEVENVLPSAESLKNIIWLIIIFVIYNILKDNSNKKETKNIKTSNEYIYIQYAKYKARYSNYINSKNEIINKLIYSIMIYNNYKTPPIIRHIKTYINHLINKEVKYGILEVSSPIPLTDIESINITLKELERKYKKLNNNHEITTLLDKYSKEEIENIALIYNIINNFS